ncbi:MAG TPA: hypothetical protein VLL97_09710, partial [Acidobacteriota bacterium]|nr:hypothetical protein [Acidobacteriota bacterium]
EDPIGLNGGINLYGYVRNNPLNGTDPSGKIPVIFYVWAQGVIASPDTRFDIEMLSRSLGNREYGNAILDLAAIAIPGVSSLHLRAAKEGGKRIVCKIGGNAASKVLNGSQIAPYRELQAVTRGQRGAIQAHHILEQRHLRAWGYSADEILQAPSQVLSRAEHTALNRSLQRELPTGTEYTRSQVWSAYERVYQNYPGYLDAISSYFK